MARWECIVCGLIYDEKDGWPDDGIAPGTKWEDVPDDWLCPDCGVGKEDFELIAGSEDEIVDAAAQESVVEATASSARHVVVVGSGLGGYGFINALRKLDADLPVTLITRDGGEVYSKPMISTGFTKDFSAEKLATQTAETMAEQLGITLRTRTAVAAIRPSEKCLELESGEKVASPSWS